MGRLVLPEAFVILIGFFPLLSIGFADVSGSRVGRYTAAPATDARLGGLRLLPYPA